MARRCGVGVLAGVSLVMAATWFVLIPHMHGPASRATAPANHMQQHDGNHAPGIRTQDAATMRHSVPTCTPAPLPVRVEGDAAVSAFEVPMDPLQIAMDLPDDDAALRQRPVLLNYHGMQYRYPWRREGFPVHGAQNLSVLQPTQPCQVPCMVTHDETLLGASDAVVLHGPDARPNALPRVRMQWRRGGKLQQMQPWISRSWEAASYYPHMADEAFVRHHFNLTERIGSKESADYATGHQYDLPRDLQPLVPLAERTGKVIALYSNCDPRNNRNVLLERLLGVLGPKGWLHSYGKCYKNREWPRELLPPGVETHERVGRHVDYTKAKANLQRRYKFELVIQNSDCRGFVDEKVFHAWLHGVVPIYHGAPDIDKYAPRGPNGEPSYILLSQFRFPWDLALHLKYLDATPREYMKYHAWRDVPQRPDRFPDMHTIYPGKPNMDAVSPECHFCTLVRQAQLNPLLTFTAAPDDGCCDLDPQCTAFIYPNKTDHDHVPDLPDLNN